MTADEIRERVNEHVAHYQAGDVSALASDHAPDGVVESSAAGTYRGRRAIEEGYRRWMTAFPDIAFTMEDVIVAIDAATIVFRAKGTHRGDFLGVPGDGKPLEFRGVLVQKFKDGQIVHELRMYDFAGILIRLGILRVKPA